MSLTNKPSKPETHFPTVETYSSRGDFKRGDTVKLYKEGSSIKYPHLLLECDKLELFRVEALRGILGKRSLLMDDSYYTVYISMDSQLVEIGVLPAERLKFIISSRVFDVFRKSVARWEGDKIEGDMLYALCLISSR